MKQKDTSTDEDARIGKTRPDTSGSSIHRRFPFAAGPWRTQPRGWPGRNEHSAVGDLHRLAGPSHPTGSECERDAMGTERRGRPESRGWGRRGRRNEAPAEPVWPAAPMRLRTAWKAAPHKLVKR